MKAVLLLALIVLTRPDGREIFVNPLSIEYFTAGPNGCAHTPDASFPFSYFTQLHLGSAQNICVEESPQQIMERMKQ